MTAQSAISRRAEELLGAAVVAMGSVAGGDINTATRLHLADGRYVLMKTNPRAPAGFFAAEADGLRALTDAGAPVPGLLAVRDDCLLLTWIEPGRPTTAAAEELGRALSALHARPQPELGWEHDGWIGRLPMPNTPARTWAEFYVSRRLEPYLRLGVDRGTIDPDDAGTIEELFPRLADLVPEEPPALLHGDLWNGNVLWGADHTAYLLDPAVHRGHRETDLAMLALFGLPQLHRVLDSYQAETPLADGWEERVGVHQLYPLLVHACMFGGGYAARAARIADELT